MEVIISREIFFCYKVRLADHYIVDKVLLVYGAVVHARGRLSVFYGNRNGCPRDRKLLSPKGGAGYVIENRL